MKNNHFFISDEGYTRAKKQLKKHLKNEGVDFTLSQCANLLAKSFGFNDEHDIQNNINAKNNEKDNLKKGLNYIKDSNSFFYMDKDLMNSKVFKHLNAIVDIWKDASDYVSLNILKIAKKSASELSSNESLYILNSIEKLIQTNYFWCENAIGLLNGSINTRGKYTDNGEVICISMAEMRNVMLKLFHLTSDGKFHFLSVKMDNYHNIETYFNLSKSQRDEFYSKYFNLKDLDSESHNYSGVYFKIKEDKRLKEVKKNIIILGEIGTGRDMLAFVLKNYLEKLQNGDFEIINTYRDFSALAYSGMSDKKGVRYIYILEAENIEMIRNKTKGINDNYNFENISLFLKTNNLKNGVGYQILEVK